MTRFARITALLCGAVLGIHARASAEEPPRVDCYLPADAVACSQLERCLGGVVEIGVLRVRARAQSHCIDYVVEHAANSDHECIDRSVPSDIAMSRVAHLARRVLRQNEATANSHGPGWYLEPSASAYYFAASGFALSTLSGQLTLNHSTPAFRVRVQGKLRHRHYSLPNGEDRIRATFLDGSASAMSMHTVHRHLGLGVVAEAVSLPYQNELLVLSTGPGLEWTLHDFLNVNDTNVAIRYELRGQHYALRSPNGGDLDSFWVARHLGTAAFRWHGDTVDVELAAVAGANALALRFWDVTLYSTVALRIVSGLRVSITFNAILRGDVQHAAADPSTLPSGYGLVGGGDFGSTTIETSLSLSYVLGDAELHASDQRWR